MADSKTALITGASSGIGAAFARQLAARGYDLVLVARRKEKLDALAEELRKDRKIGVEVLLADLAKPSDVERVEAHIRDLSGLALLINSAGFGTTGPFAEVDAAKHADMIQVHVVAAARLTRAALPGMLARKQGAVINVSSLMAFLPMHNAVTYCGTKAFLVTFTQALAKELEGAGVRAQVLCPGFTYTEFHDTPEFKQFDRASVSKTLWMTADDVVAESLAALEAGRVLCIPGRKNRLLMAFSRSPVGRLVVWLLARKRWK